MKFTTLSLLMLSMVPLTGCATGDEAPSTSDATSDLSFNRSHVVFTMSNAATGNEILAYRRSAGQLQLASTTPTGGVGSAGGLGSQGALAFAFGGRVLLAVNPGSNEVSSFLVDGTRLYPLSRVASGGARPISVAARGNLVYVLNAGEPNSVVGLYLDIFGRLHELPGSLRSLGAAAVGPAQVAFSPDGRSVVVTEKGTNMIDAFAVRYDGRLRDKVSAASAGKTPFGFAFTSQGQLVVSEASGGAPGAGTVSSYDLVGGVDRRAEVHTGPVADEQSAPCWIVITDDDQYAYATNTASGTISGYKLSDDGSLELFADGGATADTGAGSGPIDMALDRSSRRLYVLAGGSHDIQELEVQSDGSLVATGLSVTVPAAAAGLIAR